MRTQTWDFANILMLIIAFFALILQLFPPRTQIDQFKSAAYFLGIIGYVLLLYVAHSMWRKVREYLSKIDKNAQDIDSFKDQLKEEKRMAVFDKRLSILEALLRNKSGKFEFDPIWFFMIILLVLFYLYLRSLGLVP